MHRIDLTTLTEGAVGSCEGFTKFDALCSLQRSKQLLRNSKYYITEGGFLTKNLSVFLRSRHSRKNGHNLCQKAQIQTEMPY